MSSLGSLSVSILAMTVIAANVNGTTTVTFDELNAFDHTTPSGSYWNGSDGSGGFSSINAFLKNTNTSDYYWSGFAYSNVNNPTTPDYDNQYAAYTGTDTSGNGNYVVGYVPNDWMTETYDQVPIVMEFTNTCNVESVMVTNTAYAALGMKNGYMFAKKFGGSSGNDSDWFLLTITGKDASNKETGKVEYYLADYRFENNALDYIVDTWEQVDLTSLGTVKSLEFLITSSDTGLYGINTPSYFALDNLTIPEPTTIGLLAIGAIGVLARRRQAAKVSRIVVVVGISLNLGSSAYAGLFAPAAGKSGSTAISMDDPSLVSWATGAIIERGLQDISNPTLGYASYGTSEDTLGKAEGTYSRVASLGDGGSATLTFAKPITNGDGFDFAIFENGISDTFLELAFVEVSSNGTDFFRFPSVSLTQTTTQVGGFEALDPTDLDNLAGKYRGGYGTPFDLSRLEGISSLLDINHVTHVKIIDVVGCIQDAYATYDSQGHKVNDPWSTPFGSGGFDLDAVGVIHQVPEPITLGILLFGSLGLYRRSK